MSTPNSIMFPNNTIISQAHRQAQKADYRFKLGAVIYDGKKIIGTGYNQPSKTHPKSPIPVYKTIHAEFAALLSSRFKSSNSSIYVHRIRRDGKIGLAKPCRYCDVILKWAGVKEVYFSDENEKVSKL